MNNDLIRMTGVVGVVLIVAITALSILRPGDNTATITAMVSAALALLSFLSSRTNAAKIEVATAKTEANADQLGLVAEQLGDNTTLTEHTKREVGETKREVGETKQLVDGQAHEWRAAVEKIGALEAQIAGLVGVAAGRETERAIGVLTSPAQAPDVQADGTVVVTAPALIAVKVPDNAT